MKYNTFVDRLKVLQPNKQCGYLTRNAIVAQHVTDMFPYIQSKSFMTLQ